MAYHSKCQHNWQFFLQHFLLLVKGKESQALVTIFQLYPIYQVERFQKFSAIIWTEFNQLYNIIAKFIVYPDSGHLLTHLCNQTFRNFFDRLQQKFDDFVNFGDVF